MTIATEGDTALVLACTGSFKLKMEPASGDNCNNVFSIGNEDER